MVPAIQSRRDLRDNNFNLLRIVLATLVLLGHASEMAYNNRSHEPFALFTHTRTTLGDLAVGGFFVISGFLILQSWLLGPHVNIFLRKRLLRIVPGYAVAALLSTVVVGLAATHSLQFFRQLTPRYFISLLMFDSPITPSVFPGKGWNYVNGALWSIKYEFRCYLLIALGGAAGLFRRRRIWTSLAAVALAIGFVPAVQQHFLWHRWELLLGDPLQLYRLLPAFLCGGCFYLFWHLVPRSRAVAGTVALIMLPLLFLPATVLPALTICGGYLLLYVAYLEIPALDSFKRAPDLSYGLYLYGWPVEALWTWYLHTPPWATFAGSLLICLPLAWLSWHYIERPALLRKPRASVPVPDAGPGQIT